MALVLIRGENNSKLLNAIADMERHGNLNLACKPKMIDSRFADKLVEGILHSKLKTKSKVATAFFIKEDTTLSIMQIKKIHPPAHVVIVSDEYDAYDKLKLNDAKKLTLVLQKIKEKYSLSGLTIRCFDLLNSIHTTSCLGLAYFNSLGIVSACEGDIPSLISMYLVNELFNKPSFMANPSRIDITNNKMIFAHCTLPLNMTKSYKLDTHYESNIGVAIKGEMKEDVITIFKLSRNLKDYFVTSGKIIKNLNENNLCRTQIEVEVDNNINYFLNRPYGNHHIIFYGNYVKEINDFFKNRI